VTGIIRYHILEHGNAAPTMIHALIRAESIIWILGGLLFATGFGKLIKERNTAQQTPPGDSLKALPEE